MSKAGKKGGKKGSDRRQRGGDVRVIKNKAYFMRFQVKPKRRREGKTDYQARRRLVVQDKNKYNAHKYRFVVRLTNCQVLCQVVYSTIIGDHVMAMASSKELPAYGVKAGFTNFPAAYCTGLLCARRLLKSLKMDNLFEGKVDPTGEDYHIEEEIGEDDRTPFKALLDVGLARTTSGHKVFGAMKGACDGGIHIPHNSKRFPAAKNGPEACTAALRDRIFGKHVANYMRILEDESSDRLTKQFGDFIKNDITPDNIESMYAAAHKAIRADPDRKAKPARQHVPVHVRQGNYIKTFKATYFRPKKLNAEQRKARVAQKKMELAKLMVQ